MKVENLRINSQKIVDDYITQEDWRARENANMMQSYSGLKLHAASTVMAHYALKRVYPKKIADAHIKGEIHIHDLGDPLVPYCVGHSLRSVLAMGVQKVGHIDSKPAKHFTSVLMQIVNYLGIAQHEFAGANALSSIDTYLAPFIAYDKLNYKEVKQAIQEFVFNLNTTSRWGGQLNFTNITLDWIPASDLADQHIIIGGELQEDKYQDFMDEQEIFNRALMEIYLEGDCYHRPFTFPIPTINLVKEFPWDSEISELLWKLTAKYGTPYFDNYINVLEPGSVRAMCCHLRLPLNELRNKGGGGLFGAGENCGSIGVVTINLNRIGYHAKTEDEFYELLDERLELAKQSLEIKRKRINETIESGLVPLIKNYIYNMNNFFSVIGVIGMHDALLNFMNCGIYTHEGLDFAVQVLKHIRERLVEYQSETGNLYALEAVPGEGCSYRLARLDKQHCPNIRIFNLETGGTEPYLTNSTQLPVGYTDSLTLALRLQEPLQTLYNSGTVFHVYIGEAFPAPPQVVKKVIRTIATKFRIPTFTWTPTFSVCPSCGLLYGEVPKCPKCGKHTQVYSRVVGYYRPTSAWNAGKQEEFRDRKTFSVGA